MKRVPLALAALAFLAAPKAFARCEGDPSCTKLDTLLAAPGASPFASVGTSDVLSAWDAGFGFQASFVRNPIAVLVPTTSATGERLELVDRQMTASWLFAMGLGAGLEAGVAVDSVVDAAGPGLAGANAGPALRETGLGDVRTQLRWAALERPRTPSEGTVGQGFGFALTGGLTLPTGMASAFASERRVMGQLTATADYVNGPLRAAVDLGTRLRKRASVFDAKWGSQILVAGAVSYDVLTGDTGRGAPRLLSLGLEAWALPSLADDRSTLDVLATASSAPAWAGELSLVAGAGRSFVLAGPDLAAPDLRMTFAVRYAPRDIDHDGDGLVDKSDPCPVEAGPLRDTETPGCPDRAPEDLTVRAPSEPAQAAAPVVAPVPAAANEPAPSAPPAPPSEPATTPEAPKPEAPSVTP